MVPTLSVYDNHCNDLFLFALSQTLSPWLQGVPDHLHILKNNYYFQNGHFLLSSALLLISHQILLIKNLLLYAYIPVLRPILQEIRHHVRRKQNRLDYQYLSHCHSRSVLLLLLHYDKVHILLKWMWFVHVPSYKPRLHADNHAFPKLVLFR